jgi:hypothetical protein
MTHFQTSKKDPVDKSNFCFHLALYNVSDEIVPTSGDASPSILKVRKTQEGWGVELC